MRANSNSVEFNHLVSNIHLIGDPENRIDALVCAVKNKKIKQTRIRIADCFGKSKNSGNNDNIDILFSNDSYVTDEDMKFIVSTIGLRNIKSVLIAIYDYVDNYPHDNLDMKRIEEFIIDCAEVAGLKGKPESDCFRHDEKVFADPFFIYQLISKTCIDMSLDTLSKTALQLANEISSDDRMVTSKGQLHAHVLNMVKFNRAQPALSSYDTRCLEALASIMKDLPSNVNHGNNELASLFTYCLDIKHCIEPEKYSSAFNSAIEDNFSTIYEQLKDVLFDKSIKAIQVFGRRNSDYESRAIPGKMAGMVSHLVRSSLDEENKTSLCTQIIKIALEGKTPSMRGRDVTDLIQWAEDAIDYPVLVKGLNKRGLDNLLECTPDRSPFLHLLKKSYRGKVLEMDLGL